MTKLDYIQRFVFDELDARGCIVRLDESSAAIQQTHHYPAPLAKILNQFAVAAALLRDSIKIDGSVTIQLRTPGAIKLMMADCLHDRRVRAIAEYEATELAAGESIQFNQLGQGAVLAITITPEEGERYQSIVPLESVTLEACLEDYFARSEQLPTWFSLHADQQRGLGVALHALPKEKIADAKETEEHFARLNALLKTLSDEEALALESDEILTRLFHEESCRLFEPRAVEFGCECSAQKSLDAVKSLGEPEVTALINEQREAGETSLTVDCHFCFQRYEFDFDSMRSLFVQA